MCLKCEDEIKGVDESKGLDEVVLGTCSEALARVQGINFSTELAEEFLLWEPLKKSGLIANVFIDQTYV